MYTKLKSIIAPIISLVLFTGHPSSVLAGESETVIAANLRQVEIILPGTDTPQKVIYEIVGEYAIMEGDIILGKVDDRGNLLNKNLAPESVVIDGHRWSGGIIPFVINANVSAAGRTNILSAIAHWEQKTPINFVPRTTQGDFVEFVRGTSAGACSSSVGRQGGRQEIRLTPSGDCSRGALIHEIGHAVGFYHEQSREDRDNHVTIMWANIESGREHNFNKHVSGATDVGTYDFGSIMHYGAFAFCKKTSTGACVGPTIVTKPPGIPIGQRNGLSRGDIAGVLRIYNIVSHPRTLADVNGDGKKDVVAFGNDGVYVSLSTGVSFSPATRWIANYSHNNGVWRVSRHLRFLADVNGDRRDDVVGFGDAGVYVSLSTGSSFSPASLWIAEYGYNAGGWRIAQHPRVLADVNGDGRKDIVGFANDGTYVSLSTGVNFSSISKWNAEYGYVTGGWRVEFHPRELADVNGDGRQDVVGFANDGVYVALSTGTTFTQASRWIDTYGYVAGGWRVEKHPRLLADVNGDGKQDIVGFGDAGVYLSLSTGASFGIGNFVLANYGYDAAWRIERHPRFLADMNGDGRQDIVGFGDAGVWRALSTGTGFAPDNFVLATFGYNAGGWRVEHHPRFLADVTGDGKQDVVGIGNGGVYAAPSAGTFFAAPSLWINQYGYSDGWR